MQAVFGTAPVRVFPAGRAPEGAVLPYAVWQIFGGVPENYTSGAPDADSFSVQVDVYAKTVSEVRAGAEAIRDAVEPYAYITAWRGESIDQTTKNYRYSFDINFITQR